MMRVSEKGIEMVKSFEGFRAKAYRDIAGVWTIGYGHTSRVKPEMEITEQQALVLLSIELDEYAVDVQNVVKCSLFTPVQHELDALVSLAYNIGMWNFKTSTLVRVLCNGDRMAAADQFLRWNKAHVDGKLKVIAGLTKRRKREREVFLNGYAA